MTQTWKAEAVPCSALRFGYRGWSLGEKNATAHQNVILSKASCRGKQMHPATLAGHAVFL